MTDVNLLPLPAPDWVEGYCGATHPDTWEKETLIDYATACVESATAPLHAEIERLKQAWVYDLERIGLNYQNALCDSGTWAARAKSYKGQRDALAEAIRQYELEMLNPGPDYVMRHQRRKELFEALARLGGPDNG